MYVHTTRRSDVRVPKTKLHVAEHLGAARPSGTRDTNDAKRVISLLARNHDQDVEWLLHLETWKRDHVRHFLRKPQCLKSNGFPSLTRRTRARTFHPVVLIWTSNTTRDIAQTTANRRMRSRSREFGSPVRPSKHAPYGGAIPCPRRCQVDANPAAASAATALPPALP